MKKLIFILFLIPILANSQSIWTTVSVRAIAKSNDYFLVKNTDNANTEKMSLTTLTSIADSTREAKDDSIYFNCGLTTLGKYDTEATSNFMKAADFATMSYQPDIHNATLLLDSVIADIDQWSAGSGTYAVIQKNCQDTAGGAYALAIGYETEAQWAASFSHGTKSVAYKATMRAFASGAVELKGVAQWGANQYVEIVEYLQTTDATADTLVLAGTDNAYLTIPTDMAASFEVTLIGVQNSGVVGETYTRTIGGALKNLAGTTALVGTVDTLVNNADASTVAWLCSVTADDVSDALIISVTGAASTTIHWTAYIKMTTVGIRNFTLK